MEREKEKERLQFSEHLLPNVEAGMPSGFLSKPKYCQQKKCNEKWKHFRAFFDVVLLCSIVYYFISLYRNMSDLKSWFSGQTMQNFNRRGDSFLSGGGGEGSNATTKSRWG